MARITLQDILPSQSNFNVKNSPLKDTMTGGKASSENALKLIAVDRQSNMKVYKQRIMKVMLEVDETPDEILTVNNYEIHVNRLPSRDEDLNVVNNKPKPKPFRSKPRKLRRSHPNMWRSSKIPKRQSSLDIRKQGRGAGRPQGAKNKPKKYKNGDLLDEFYLERPKRERRERERYSPDLIIPKYKISGEKKSRRGKTMRRFNGDFQFFGLPPEFDNTLGRLITMPINAAKVHSETDATSDVGANRTVRSMKESCEDISTLAVSSMAHEPMSVSSRDTSLNITPSDTTKLQDSESSMGGLIKDQKNSLRVVSPVPKGSLKSFLSLPTDNLPDGCQNNINAFPVVSQNQIDISLGHDVLQNEVKTSSVSSEALGDLLESLSSPSSRFSNLSREKIGLQAMVTEQVIPEANIIEVAGKEIKAEKECSKIIKTKQSIPKPPKTVKAVFKLEKNLEVVKTEPLSPTQIISEDQELFESGQLDFTAEPTEFKTVPENNGHQEEKTESSKKKSAKGAYEIGEDGKIGCHMCNKRLKQTSFKQHLKTHEGFRPFVCNICNSSFTRKSDLDRHVKIVHNRVKPFSCTKCSKVFSDKSNFRLHMSSHERVRMISCTICGIYFSDYEQWEKHINQFHEKKEGAPKEEKKRPRKLKKAPPKIKIKPMAEQVKPATDGYQNTVLLLSQPEAAIWPPILTTNQVPKDGALPIQNLVLKTIPVSNDAEKLNSHQLVNVSMPPSQGISYHLDPSNAYMAVKDQVVGTSQLVLVGADNVSDSTFLLVNQGATEPFVSCPELPPSSSFNMTERAYEIPTIDQECKENIEDNVPFVDPECKENIEENQTFLEEDDVPFVTIVNPSNSSVFERDCVVGAHILSEDSNSQLMEFQDCGTTFSVPILDPLDLDCAMLDSDSNDRLPLDQTEVFF